MHDRPFAIKNGSAAREDAAAQTCWKKVAIFMFAPKQTDENLVQNTSCVGQGRGAIVPSPTCSRCQEKIAGDFYCNSVCRKDCLTIFYCTSYR
jgi:hypothetical protein